MKAINPRTFAPRNLAVAATAVLIAVAGVAVTVDSADAQSRSRSRSVTATGPHHSATRNTDVYRSRGSASVTRSGTIDGQAYSSSRSRSTVATDNGYATTTTHVGPAGNTQTRTGEVYYDGDSYHRSSSLETSNGYGYDRSVDATRDENGSVVNRSATTNNGATRSSTVVRPY